MHKLHSRSVERTRNHELSKSELMLPYRFLREARFSMNFRINRRFPYSDHLPSLLVRIIGTPLYLQRPYKFRLMFMALECVYNIKLKLVLVYYIICGPGSSVGTATEYGLRGPGSNPGGDEIIRPSRSAMGPTQPPVQWVPGFPGGKVRPGRAADRSPPSSTMVMEE